MPISDCHRFTANLHKHVSLRACVLLAVALASTSAFAHTGAHSAAMLTSSSTHGQAWLTGLWHTFSGWDHWAAALLVGLWSSLTLPRRQVWLGPLSFCGVVAAGTWFALQFGVHSALSDWIEPMILTSVGVLLALAALRVHLGLPTMALGLATFGLWHGLAHGLELSQITYAGSIAGGVLCGTAAAHLIGALLGQVFHRHQPRIRNTR